MSDPPEYNPEADWEARGLTGALAAFQAALPHVSKDAGGVVRDGKRLKYADLAPVSHIVLAELGKRHIAWTCKPLLRDDGRFVLRYKLKHAPSGEAEEGDYPLKDGSAQQQGSEITYARRYCLLAVTGVAPEGDDDDGHAASQVKPQRQQKPRPEANWHGQADRLKGLITSIQIRYKELGFKPAERDDMLRASEQIIGHALTGPHEGRTHNNLSEADARKLRDTLGGFKDRGDLLAALVEAATP